MLRKQHSVTEYIPRHVTNTHTGKVFSLAINTNLSEVAFDRFPRAFGGDPHFLMVVTDAPARSKGITQPEAIFIGNAIGNIREGRGAFIGSNNQVRVIIIVSYHIFRVNQFAIADVIGHIK